MTYRKQVDTYYWQAKKEGYIARSVYKLIDIDKRYHLLSIGQKVLDFGAHPGSWIQYICEKIGPSGLAVGIDIKPLLVSLPKWGRFLNNDLFKITIDELRFFSFNYDLVLSDAAPSYTGIMYKDMACSYELTNSIIKLALKLLKPGGSLVAKVYWSTEVTKLIHIIKTFFRLAKAHKPKASYLRSKEIYLIGHDLIYPAP